MTDVHSPERRSKNMQAIRHKNTTPELLIRRLLHARGFRFRLHVRDLAGSPDIVLPKFRAAIFVHGCFWHGHGCHLFKLPQTRREFWENKINTNRARDVRNMAALQHGGWRVLTVWECAIKGRFRQPEDVLVDSIERWIRSDSEMAVFGEEIIVS
jgi:DNA mismatch endonuclease (patch repair protein)